MTEITLVTSSLLYKDKNEQLYNYFDEVTPLFAFLVRRTIHHLNHNLNGEDITKYRTRLKQEYGLTNRFAKAVVTTAKNTFKLSTAAGDYLHSTYATKTKKVNAKIVKTKAIQYIKGSKYIYGEFIIKDNVAKREILKTLKSPKSNPLSFRIIKRNEILQLQIMYRTSSEPKTRNSNGVIGVDFNKGFITISEIDQHGKLLNLDRIDYIHKGKASVTKNSMHHLVKDLVNVAILSGKDIVIEDLKSLNKNKKEKNERKHYNRMINTLKFSKFRKFLETRCDKLGVGLSLVNPYNTSKIANNKYCYDMKLNIHSGASYVIARRFYELD